MQLDVTRLERLVPDELQPEVLVICLNYAVRLSRTGVEIKHLAQEVALLRARLERVDPGGRLAG